MKTLLTTIFVLALLIACRASERGRVIDSLCIEANREIYINPLRALELGHEAFNLCEIVDEKLQVLAVLLTAYRAIHDYDNLVAFGQMAEKLSEKGEMKSVRVRTYVMLASLYHSIKLYQEGLELLDKSEEILLASASQAPPEEINFLLGNNYLIRAFIYRDQVGCHVATPFFIKALKHYDALVDKSFYNVNANISTALYNYGNCLTTETQYKEAEQQYHKAIAAAKSAATPSLLGFAYKGLGRLYTLNGDFDSSLQVLMQAQEQAEGVGDPMLEQSIYAAIANNHLAKGDWQQYLNNSEKSTDLQVQILKKSKSSVLQLMQSNFTTYDEEHQKKSLAYRYALAFRLLGGFVILMLLILAFRTMSRRLHHLKIGLGEFKKAKT